MRQEQDGPTLYILVHCFVQNLFDSNAKNLTGILSCTFVYADHLQKLYILSYDIYMYMIPIHKLTFMENIFVTVNNYLIPSQLELLKL